MKTACFSITLASMYKGIWCPNTQDTVYPLSAVKTSSLITQFFSVFLCFCLEPILLYCVYREVVDGL
jgi:hypothetical protein